MKPEPELGTRCGRRGASKKRRNSSSCGSSESPEPTFLRTSTNTTAGSALSTTPTNGLSGTGDEELIAESRLFWAVDSICTFSPALSPRPITNPTNTSSNALT